MVIGWLNREREVYSRAKNHGRNPQKESPQIFTVTFYNLYDLYVLFHSSFHSFFLSFLSFIHFFFIHFFSFFHSSFHSFLSPQCVRRSCYIIKGPRPSADGIQHTHAVEPVAPRPIPGIWDILLKDDQSEDDGYFSSMSRKKDAFQRSIVECPINGCNYKTPDMGLQSLQYLLVHTVQLAQNLLSE